jgi:hypothetical protein
VHGEASLLRAAEGACSFLKNTITDVVVQAGCGVPGCRGAARYRFASDSQAPDQRCRWHGLVYPPVCGRAVRVALVVGTILVGINQSDVLLSGHIMPSVLARMALTYVVPFLVSTYSALGANRMRGS